MSINPNFAAVIKGELAVKASSTRTRRTTKLQAVTIGHLMDHNEAFDLGISKVKSLEVGNISSNVDGTADILIDGSTLTNVFDPAKRIKSLASLLSPKGKLFLFAMGSNHGCPYSMITPLWLFDYFVVNGFSRCEVYAVITKIGGTNVLMLDPSSIGNRPWTPNVEAAGATIHLIVVAERMDASTSHNAPIQHQYRDTSEAEAYKRKFKVIAGNTKPALIHSTIERFVHVPPGYQYIAPSIADVQA